MTQPITPLRQRMLDDMRLRNLAAGTRRSYVRSVADFSAFHGRSPDQLTLEDVRDYQLHLVARGLKATRLLTSVADPKMRALLTTIYAAGLRVSEAVALQVGDID